MQQIKFISVKNQKYMYSSIPIYNPQFKFRFKREKQYWAYSPLALKVIIQSVNLTIARSHTTVNFVEDTSTPSFNFRVISYFLLVNSHRHIRENQTVSRWPKMAAFSSGLFFRPSIIITILYLTRNDNVLYSTASDDIRTN